MGGTCRLGLLLRYSLCSAEYPLVGTLGDLGDCCCMLEVDRPKLLSEPPFTASRGLFTSGGPSPEAPASPHTPLRVSGGGSTVHTGVSFTDPPSQDSLDASCPSGSSRDGKKLPTHLIHSTTETQK